MREDLKAQQLFEEVLQKTETGRIRWEPTAKENLFIAPIGGQFTLAVSENAREDGYGNEYTQVVLVLKDKERELITVTTDIEGVEDFRMRQLYELARRLANKVDDQIDKVLGELSKL